MYYTCFIFHLLHFTVTYDYNVIDLCLNVAQYFRSCDDPTKKCNCDINDDVWRQDAGYITTKYDLPIQQFRAGDTGKCAEIPLSNVTTNK